MSPGRCSLPVPGLACRGRSGSSQARYSGGLELRGVPLSGFLGPVICCEQHVHRGHDEQVKLPPERAPTRRHWSRHAGTRTSRIDQGIAALGRLKLTLPECIGCGCLSLERCKLANPGDRAAHFGPVRATGSATDHQAERRASLVWNGSRPAYRRPPVAVRCRPQRSKDTRMSGPSGSLRTRQRVKPDGEKQP